MDYSKYTQGQDHQGPSGPALVLASTGPNATSKHSRSDASGRQQFSEGQREERERQTEMERVRQELQSEKASLRAELASEKEHLRDELAAEAKAAAAAAQKAAKAAKGELFVAPDQQNTEEAKESKLREEEKQQLHEELASERERLQKELAQEEEHLKEELASEAKEEQAEKAKATPPAQLAAIPAGSRPLVATGALALGVLAAVAFAARLRRQRQADAAEDYLMYVEAPMEIA